MNYKKIFTFPVLYKGWECDPEGWIIEYEDGKRAILLTNHGAKYIATAQELRNKIAEYQGAITETNKALKLIEGKQTKEERKISK